MEVGNLVWFDSFYHAEHNYHSPKDYALQAVIIKRYTEQEKIYFHGPRVVMWNNEDLYDIMIDGKIYIAYAGMLISIYRSTELI